MQNKFDQLKNEANNLYQLLVNNPMNNNLIDQYSDKYNQIQSKMRFIAAENEQRMKMNWLIRGDKPTYFFYSKMADTIPKRRSNLILNTDGYWNSASDKLASEAINFFSSLFNSSQAINQFPDIICNKILSEQERKNLCKPFQQEDIKTAIFQINDNITPGPDDINSMFYKVHWSQISYDILNAMNGILLSGKFIREINHTFICLILKKSKAVDLTDFRPISPCNVSYKFLANLLCNRMNVYMNDLISYNQNAFIPGRIITDNSLLSFEIVGGFNRKILTIFA